MKLMTKEALALHAVPIQRYNGKILSNPSFQPRLLFDGSYYLRTGGTFTANFNEWDATMFPIARDTSNISTATPIYLDRSPSGKTSSSAGAGNTPNDINIGKVGGMQLDAQNQKLGPFQEITSGGRVVGIFNATGAATLNSTLAVTGNATLTGDTDFEGSHTASIEDATHNDGSEYEVKNTDFIVFNKWDGNEKHGLHCL